MLTESERMNQPDPDNKGKDQKEKGQHKRSVAEIRNAARIAAQGLRLGKPPAEIIARLRQTGLTYREAEGIEDHARVAYQRSQIRIGTMLMVSAVLWLVAAFAVPVLIPSPNATRYSWAIFIAALLQWAYGWQRRRRALRIRPIKGKR